MSNQRKVKRSLPAKSPTATEATTTAGSKGRPESASKYLAGLVDQFFAFIDKEKNKDAQATKLLELEALWKAWLVRPARLFDGTPYEHDFMDRIAYYLKDRVALVNKKRELQTEQPEIEGGTAFEGF